jgi:hypothetical protein
MHFLITGDSWSQGEWDGYPNNYHVAHRGIEQYLLDDGYRVTNVGQGGYNNLESLLAVTDTKFDHLVFFYTDPLRQATKNQIQYQLPNEIIRNHNIYLSDRFLEIKQLTNCKLSIIGGCAKYIGDTIHVDYCVPSFSELVVPGFVDTIYMTSREWEEHFFKHEKQFSVEQKIQWLEVMEKAGEKYTLWNMNKSLFWPDGLHANRHAIYILYQQLKKLWFNE